MIIFAHGTAGFRHQSLAQMTHWASHGFVVAAVDHPGLKLGDLLAFSFDQDLTADLNTLYTRGTLERVVIFGWLYRPRAFGAAGIVLGAAQSVRFQIARRSLSRWLLAEHLRPIPSRAHSSSAWMMALQLTVVRSVGLNRVLEKASDRPGERGTPSILRPL